MHPNSGEFNALHLHYTQGVRDRNAAMRTGSAHALNAAASSHRLPSAVLRPHPAHARRQLALIRARCPKTLSPKTIRVGQGIHLSESDVQLCLVGEHQFRCQLLCYL